MPRTRFAAHRGGAALWPENSLLAFRRAIALGAPLVELDVHPSVEGMPVVIHDRTLERTTDAHGPVADRPLDELRRTRLKGPDGALTDERLPTFEEVLALVAPSPTDLLLEVKGPAVAVVYERSGSDVHAIPGPRYEGLEERLLERLGTHAMAARTSVIAFNPGVLTRVHALAPGMRTTLLVARRHVELAAAEPEDAIAWAVAAGAGEIGLEHTLVDTTVVRAARSAGLGIGVWTVNDEDGIRRYVALDVDVLTTDRPDVAARVLCSG